MLDATALHQQRMARRRLRRRRSTSINPATEETITSVPSAGRSDVDRAVTAARAALDGPWGALSARERGRLVWRLGEKLMERADEIARLETLHNGKPIFESRQIEVPAAAECFQYFAGWADKIHGETIPVKGNYLDLHAARAGRRRRRDHAVELPAAADRLEGRARARLRQHGRHQAGEPDTADRAGARRVAMEAGFPPGVLNVVTGPGSTRRPDDRRASRHRQDRVHRRHVDRARRSCAVGRHAEADHARAGRQVAEHRVRRRRPRRRRPGRDDRHLLRQGRGVRGRFAAARREVDQRRVHRQGRRAREEDDSRRSAGSQDAPRGDRLEERSSRPISDYIETAKREGATLVAGGGAPTSAPARAIFCSRPYSPASPRR